MNKDKLQQELKEKIKEGIKPSDLKKRGNTIPTPPPPPPIGKEENTEDIHNPDFNPYIGKVAELQENVKYWSDTAANYLKRLGQLEAELDNQQDNQPTKSDEGYESEDEEPNKTKALELALKEANSKIRELQEQEKQWKETINKSNLLINDKDQTIKELQQNNQSLNKTIQSLQKQIKVMENNKGTNLETFNCYNCQQNQPTSLLVLEIPDKGLLCKTCWQLFRQQTKKQPTKFTCHSCQESKQEKEYKVKLDSSLQEYSICSACLPLIKEYNEKELDSERELDIWE